MGGTLDINTFYLPLRHLSPCTFNIAIDIRTRVRLLPHSSDKVKISSTGFSSAEYTLEKAPFDHPLGLMFAIAAYFGARGIHIEIDSSSPPKSALGGSSAAAVALVAALLKAIRRKEITTFYQKREVAQLAHKIEESVAGVPCGLQDQLASVYGGIHAWDWRPGDQGADFSKRILIRKPYLKAIEKHILLAYCGVPHESKNTNQKWIKQFISGIQREFWHEIVTCTKKFVDAFSKRDFKKAILAMNAEMAIRIEMTPDVLDKIGVNLVDVAVKNNCGARFTGAGGGGCIWAVGDVNDIDRLKHKWEIILSGRKAAGLLNVKIDGEGLRFG